MEHLKLLTVVISMLATIKSSDCQFLYPADENPPTFSTRLTCFACQGEEGCDEIQDRQMGNRTETCSAIRAGCWILRNMETGRYTRTCRRPASLRQGVFCNRHMENREFCYGYESSSGRVRICAKCCIGDRCNFGVLSGRPHPELQTCVACDGSDNDHCNNELAIRDLQDSTYTEQCLFPNSDCWKERRTRNGRTTYVRGCQLQQCDEHNIKENCTFHENIQEEKCTKCCENNLCNRVQFEARINKATRSYTSSFIIFVFALTPSIFCL